MASRRVTSIGRIPTYSHRQDQQDYVNTSLKFAGLTTSDNGIYSIRASNYATGRLKAPVDSDPIVIAVTLPENSGTAIRAKTIKLKDPEKTAYGALGGTVLVEATITDAPSKTKYVWQKLQTDGTTWVDQKSSPSHCSRCKGLPTLIPATTDSVPTTGRTSPAQPP